MAFDFVRAANNTFPSIIKQHLLIHIISVQIFKKISINLAADFKSDKKIQNTKSFITAKYDNYKLNIFT